MDVAIEVSTGLPIGCGSIVIRTRLTENGEKQEVFATTKYTKLAKGHVRLLAAKLSFVSWLELLHPTGSGLFGLGEALWLVRGQRLEAVVTRELRLEATTTLADSCLPTNHTNEHE